MAEHLENQEPEDAFSGLVDMEQQREAFMDEPVPSGFYTARCSQTNWLPAGDARHPDRLLLHCRAEVETDDGPRRLSFKLSPEEWRIHPRTKRPTKVTPRNQHVLARAYPDALSRRWTQALEVLQQEGALSANPEHPEVAEALANTPLTYHVNQFENEQGRTISYVKRISG